MEHQRPTGSFAATAIASECKLVYFLLEFELAVFVLAYSLTFYFLLYFFDRHHIRGYCPAVSCSLKITISALYIAMLSANK